MSAQYAVLSEVIKTPHKGIKATSYDGDSSQIRWLWPKVLGQTKNTDLVLCKELDPVPGTTDQFTQKHWRCFMVDLLGVALGDMFVVRHQDRPEQWRVKHLRRQNSIDDVELFR